MTKLNPKSPVVFAGPSLSPREVKELLPEATVCPPVARGNLYQAREQGARVILIIDGVFSHQLAISPREVVDVARDGALILGASSMGALRAAECWPVGVRGYGLVYRLYRRGILDTDDEVAVATDPENDYAAVSVALINVRYALSKAVHAGRVDRPTAQKVLEAAKRLFFPDRQWKMIFKRAEIGAAAQASLEGFCRELDLKRNDALLSVKSLGALLRDQPALLQQHARPEDAPGFDTPIRYPGHDPLFGVEPEALQLALFQWLLGSGRYQKYIWPLVATDAELASAAAEEGPPEENPMRLREGLARILGRITTDAAEPAARLWTELEFNDELAAEATRWHAVKRAAEEAQRRGLALPKATLARVREEVAIAHGVRDWAMLQESVEADRLFDAIPVKWIEQACERLAFSRTCAEDLLSNVERNPR